MFRIGNEEIEAVAKVIHSKKIWRYMQSSEANQFEEELKEAMSSKHTLVLSSGTASLLCGLVALGIGPGDEVIVPGYTFISTALAPMALGATPIIAEVDESLTIDPEDIIRKITPKTKVIIPVHINGLPCNMDKIMAIARENNLHVLEDACQAVGGSYNGKSLGTIGNVGAFSFNYFKTISCGEGGALLTNDTAVYEKSRIYHDAGCAFFSPHQEVVVPYFAGVNYRMSEILSAIMRVQLKRLDGIIEDLRIRKKFLIENLCKPLGWKLSPINDDSGDCALKLGIFFQNHEETQYQMEFLKSKGFALNVECPLNSDRHVYVNWEAVLEGRSLFKTIAENNTQSVGSDGILCPKSLDYLGKTMYIIINPEMNLDDLGKICDLVIKSR